MENPQQLKWTKLRWQGVWYVISARIFAFYSSVISQKLRQLYAKICNNLNYFDLFSVPAQMQTFKIKFEKYYPGQTETYKKNRILLFKTGRLWLAIRLFYVGRVTLMRVATEALRGAKCVCETLAATKSRNSNYFFFQS